MKTPYFLASLMLMQMVPLPSQAEDINLPGLADQTRVGRVQVFQSPKRVTWFVPMAFSSSFECSPRSGSGFRSCTLNVINALTADEQEAIQALQTDGKTVSFFRDIDTTVVSKVRDRFSELQSSLQAATPLLMQTLALSGKYPYASIALRLKNSDAEELLNKYQGEGLGNFVSEVRFNAEQTELYLELRDTAGLRGLMERSQNNALKAGEIKSFVIQAMDRGDFSVKDMTPEEAKSSAYTLILTQYFKLGRNKRYQAISTKLRDLPKSLIILDESYSTPYVCRATLPLQMGAKQTLECETPEVL